MAQYISFDDQVEVIGLSINSFLKAIPAYESLMIEILRKHGLPTIEPENWYSQTLWLQAFKEIGEKYGSNTLFAIGKAIPENAIFPPEIQTIEQALHAIDVAYHMNHRNGEIGYYKVIAFDFDSRFAIMECKNPYPSHFDRGIIMTMARKFRPQDSIVVEVVLDENKPTRLNGAESCTYRVSW